MNIPTKNIECEIRSFVTRNQYDVLVKFFKKQSEFLGEDNQTTYYFDSVQDLRIQKNNNFSKIWLKGGKIHDEHREEIEVKYRIEDFEKMEKLFLTLGYKVAIKWFRRRLSFKWYDVDVALDYTKGYGYIIELEKMSLKNKEDETVDYLKSKLKELKMPLTPKEEFNEKYQYYKENWRKLTNDSK